MREEFIGTVDVQVFGGGTVFLLLPVSDEAKAWLNQHTEEDAPHLGHALAVEHRYLEDLIHGLVDAGFNVTLGGQ
jgi:hypothetical protein